jgi:hypothetical protein
MGGELYISLPSNKSVNVGLLHFPYTVNQGKEIIMSELYDPIDSLVSELKRNTGFLNKLLFPKASILIGTIGVLIALVLFIK